jgi:hypothetical protein
MLEDFLAGLPAVVRTPPGHPPGQRDRRDPAHSIKAGLNQGVNEPPAGVCGPHIRSVDHVLGSRLQRLAKTTDILPGLLDRSRRWCQRSRLVFPQARLWVWNCHIK